MSDHPQPIEKIQQTYIVQQGEKKSDRGQQKSSLTAAEMCDF